MRSRPQDKYVHSALENGPRFVCPQFTVTNSGLAAESSRARKKLFNLKSVEFTLLVRKLVLRLIVIARTINIERVRSSYESSTKELFINETFR